MTASKDTASFFENGTTEQFEFCFKLYPEVLKLKAEKRCKKPQELIRLDEWYQNELPKLIKARGKDAHMVYDELVQTMKWKQSRGKFYPQLSYLVKVNTPRAVMQETKKAFRKLPNLEQAITALSNLKGVGTTMASALLAAAAPDSAPFMADECLMAIPEIEGIDYTTKEYLNFVHHIEATVARLNKEAGGESPFWSPHRVELALWAHYVANDLSPELLDEMPGPGAGGGANTNGSAAKAAAKAAQAAKELDGGDDTNDGDDESLGAAVRGETNNTATESETDNENTNPIPAVMAVAGGVLQDGDSNFVSNDSTSQEPIIDDNTTQTTATTSTDEGEAGTPLASDSESNLEAPARATHASNAAGLAVGVATVVAPLLASSNSRNNNCTNSNSDIDISDNGNNSSSSRSNRATAVEAVTASTVAVTDTLTAAGNVNGNGNGTLEAPVGTVSDGENSSCLRSMGNNEEASEEDEAEAEEDDHIADENSNSHAQSHKSVTPIIGINDGTNNTADTNNDSTLGSTAGGVAVAQKRALHCDADGLVDDANSQPELKKIRSD